MWQNKAEELNSRYLELTHLLSDPQITQDLQIGRAHV